MTTNSSASERMAASAARSETDRGALRASFSQQSGLLETGRPPVRIIVADSEAIFRVGMGKIFAIEKDMEVVAQTETLAQTLNAVATNPADVILFEAGLSPNPAESVTEVIRRAQPSARIIVISHFVGEDDTVDYLRRGVRGILTRSISPELLVRCVRKVSMGETWLDNQGVNWIIEAYRSQADHGTSPKQQLRLSEKEMLIIGGVTQGLKNKDIALEVGTTEQVVKNYLRKIYDKLGVTDRLELALYSMHRRLLDGFSPSGREVTLLPAEDHPPGNGAGGPDESVPSGDGETEA